MKHYHVGSNTPGYLPESDVWTTESAQDAKDSMIEDLDRSGDFIFDGGETEDERALADDYSATMEDLNLANVSQGWSVTLPTSTSQHDLGMAYWIAPCTDDCDMDVSNSQYPLDI